MTGDWEWSQRTADYWRHFFSVPMRHGGNPFADYYPPDMEPAITQTPQPTIAVLATELQGLLSSTSASGELLELLTVEQRTTFMEVLHILSSSQSTPLEDIDWCGLHLANIAACTIALQRSPLPENKPCCGRVRVCGTSVHAITTWGASGIPVMSAAGCRECHSSAANEDGYDILWYRSGTLDRRTCIYTFSAMGRGSTQEPPCRFYIFTALLPNLFWMTIYLPVFGVLFGLHWTFSEDRHYIREVQPRDLL